MGPSMLPTLRSQGDWIVHDRISHRLPSLSSWFSWLSSDTPSSPRHPYIRGQRREEDGILGIQRGSLIIYTSPLERSKTVCKRLIGLPGDVICVDPFPDPPVSSKTPSQDDEGPRIPDEGQSESRDVSHPQHIVVPQGHFWAVGDNRAATRDSTTYGPVPFALVHGQARAIVSVSASNLPFVLVV